MQTRLLDSTTDASSRQEQEQDAHRGTRHIEHANTTPPTHTQQHTPHTRTTNNTPTTAIPTTHTHTHHTPSSAWEQLTALLRHKELPAIRAKPAQLIATVLFPALLCALLVLGVTQATVEPVDAAQYAPSSLTDALDTLSPERLEPLLLSSVFSDEELARFHLNISVPGWIPPLWLYLAYASTPVPPLYTRLPPYDGTCLAVAPDTPLARATVEPMLNRTQGLVDDALGKLGRPSPPPVRTVYFASEADLEAAARHSTEDIWGGHRRRRWERHRRQL